MQYTAYNSVEVLYHIATKRTIVRVWGKTVYDRECSDLAEEINRAFSNKPCLGVPDVACDRSIDNEIELHKIPLRRFSFKKCSTWSNETYSDEGDVLLSPAICNLCEKISSQTKWNILHPPGPSRFPIIKLEGKGETEECKDQYDQFKVDETASDNGANQEGVNIDFEEHLSGKSSPVTNVKPATLGDINDIAETLFHADSNEGVTDWPPKVIKIGRVKKDTKTEFSGSGVLVIQNETDGLELVSADTANHKQEYKGDSPPFQDRERWMKMLFPEQYNRCPFCHAGFKNESGVPVAPFAV